MAAGPPIWKPFRRRFVEVGADCGIANDGDADRCLAVDERGEVLDGDQIMLICALI